MKMNYILLLIILLSISVAAFAFRPKHKMTVPLNSQAGDLALESCEHKTKIKTYRADCGTLVVPENRLNPSSRLIALPAISLVSQTSLLSAIANDTAADMVYAQQVYAYGGEGDTLIGISTSGNARNVIHAMQVARALGLHTISLTGPTGGTLKPLCESVFAFPVKVRLLFKNATYPYSTFCARCWKRNFSSDLFTNGDN